jgi:hypothetical protein
MGDPWDHPKLLASIDEICAKHFRTKQKTDSTGLNPDPTDLAATSLLTKLKTASTGLNPDPTSQLPVNTHFSGSSSRTLPTREPTDQTGSVEGIKAFHSKG